MTTLDASALAAFVAVARAGSFTRAAEQLGTQKAHLSRVIRRLETQLGAALLQRSTRSLTVTEIGREVLERAAGILAAMDETARVAQRAQGEPRGVLRVTCGVEFGLLAVNAWIAAYLEAHRQVRVEADFTNRVVDIIHEGFDVAIRVGALDDSGLGVRKLGEVRYALFAAPSYLAARKAPRRPAELTAHELVLSTQTASGRVWKLVRGDREEAIALTPRLLVNTHLAARDATLAGLGIALLPAFQARPFVESGALQPVLAGWERPPVLVSAVFPSLRFLTPKVRAFVDTARAGFATTVGGGVDEG